MGKGKFVIDGEIESKPESAYLKEQRNKYSAKIVGVLWGLSLLCFIFFIFSLYLIFKIDSLTTKMVEMNEKVVKASSLIQENQAYKETNDTLQKRVIKLKKENDILSENNDSVGGIFFEVQIGNFYDFNIDAYMSELEALRQEKSGNTSKLILGRFRSFQKAMLFENDIKKMGFANAFLVGRIDGKLVDYQEALSAYQKQQSR